MQTFEVTYIPTGYSEPVTETFTTETEDYGYAADEAIEFGYAQGETIEVRGQGAPEVLYRNPRYA